MNQDRGLEARLHLATANVELVAVVVAKAAERGVRPDGLCVLVLDIRDAVAHELTAAVLERSGALNLQQEQTRLEDRGMIPTGILALDDLKAAKAILRVSHPLIASSLDRTPRAGTVRVVAIAEGGASLLHLPIRPIAAVSKA